MKGHRDQKSGEHHYLSFSKLEQKTNIVFPALNRKLSVRSAFLPPVPAQEMAFLWHRDLTAALLACL